MANFEYHQYHQYHPATVVFHFHNYDTTKVLLINIIDIKTYFRERYIARRYLRYYRYFFVFFGGAAMTPIEKRFFCENCLKRIEEKGQSLDDLCETCRKIVRVLLEVSK